MKKAFTMIELIFVIVVLGILSAVALPKFGTTKNMADESKGRADVAAIRSGILTERQSRIIKGDSAWITRANLDGGNGDYFGGVLTYGIVAGTSDNGWSGTAGSGTYIFSVDGTSTTLTYYDSTEATVSKRGTFTCTRGTDASGKLCKRLVD